QAKRISSLSPNLLNPLWSLPVRDFLHQRCGIAGGAGWWQDSFLELFRFFLELLPRLVRYTGVTVCFNERVS
ncbi:MAG: DUF2410 domain-containing protein, partial [Verrucomicrobia subdivision 3 bacterium]|nr:DUF2410 domain-containing protein [Limisphaerales bacterium]